MLPMTTKLGLVVCQAFPPCHIESQNKRYAKDGLFLYSIIANVTYYNKKGGL